MKKTLAILLFLSCIICTAFPTSAYATSAGFPFNDVGEKHWAREAVAWAYEEGITAGTGANSFSPQGSITNAMFYMMLFRLEGCPAPEEEISLRYVDVPANAYYRKALEWAAAANMVNWREIYFHPNMTITRGEMAEALFEYEIYYRRIHHPELPSWSLTEPEPFPPRFTDVNRDPDSCWGMRVILHAGIMTGRSSTTFAPDASSTRAEGVAVLWRMQRYLRVSYAGNATT